MTQKKSFFVGLCLLFVVFLSFSDENTSDESVFHPQDILKASYKGDAIMVSRILTTNPDKDVRDSIGATALHGAMFQPNILVVKLLLEYGYDPNALDMHGSTPLHRAVSANNLEAAKLLMQYGADSYLRNNEGLTPIAKARREQKGAMEKILY